MCNLPWFKLIYFDYLFYDSHFSYTLVTRITFCIKNFKLEHFCDFWDATLHDGSRTNNMCESWNHAFKSLLGYNNPTIWACIEALKKDNTMVCLALDNHERGILYKKRINQKSANLQEKLRNLCEEHENGRRRNVSFLTAVGRTIRFSWLHLFIKLIFEGKSNAVYIIYFHDFYLYIF